MTATYVVHLGQCGQYNSFFSSCLIVIADFVRAPPYSVPWRALKAAFHDTDTDILADILARIVARMSVSWNAGITDH